MPSFASITLQDRESSPADHVFNPVATGEQGVAVFQTDADTPAGAERLTHSVKRMANGQYRVRVTMNVPVVVTETVNGVSNPVNQRFSRSTHDFYFDENSTLQERKNHVGMIYDLLATDQAFTTGGVEKLQSYY